MRETGVGDAEPGVFHASGFYRGFEVELAAGQREQFHRRERRVVADVVHATGDARGPDRADHGLGHVRVVHHRQTLVRRPVRGTREPVGDVRVAVAVDERQAQRHHVEPGLRPHPRDSFLGLPLGLRVRIPALGAQFVVLAMRLADPRAVNEVRTDLHEAPDARRGRLVAKATAASRFTEYMSSAVRPGARKVAAEFTTTLTPSSARLRARSAGGRRPRPRRERGESVRGVLGAHQHPDVLIRPCQPSRRGTRRRSTWTGGAGDEDGGVSAPAGGCRVRDGWHGDPPA